MAGTPNPLGAIQTQIFAEYERLTGLGAVAGKETYDRAIRNVTGRGGILSKITSIVGNLPADFIRDQKEGLILGVLGVEGINIVQRFIEEGRLDLNPVPLWLAPAFRAVADTAESAIGAPLFDLLIRTPMGGGLSSAPGTPGAEAVRIIEKLFGFGTALDFGSAELHDVVKAAMGTNAPTGLLEAIKNLPMNVGVNWAIGFIISELVTTAAMPPMVEEVQRRIRGSRLGTSQALSLWRLGIIDEGELQDRLAGAGLPDRDIALSQALTRQMVGISELQGAYQFGLMSEDEVREYLSKLGFAPSDAELVIGLYLKRAETAGGDQLRGVAQRGFLDGHLTEQQYRDILSSVNVPVRSIELEVQAASLTKEWNRTSFTLTQIKTFYQNGQSDGAVTLNRLLAAKYTEEDARSLINEWDFERARTVSGVSESRVLSYLKSGILTEAEAYDRLIAMGIKSADAAFLVKHPDASVSVKTHNLDKDTIVSAMLDDVLTQVQAHQKLLGLDYSEDDATLIIREALVKFNRGKKPKQPVKTLGESHVLDALKYGLATPAWAIRELVTLGYTEPDAMLLVQIEITKLSGEVPSDWVVLV